MRWWALTVCLMAAAAGCRSDEKAPVQAADPAPVAVIYDAAPAPVVPADAGADTETERFEPLEAPAPATRGDIEVPILILEE